MPESSAASGAIDWNQVNAQDLIVKLGDFGISSLSGGARANDEYAAPEVVQGKIVAEYADIFSVGMIAGKWHRQKKFENNSPNKIEYGRD